MRLMRVSKMEWRGVRVPLRQPELALDPSKAGRNALLIWMHMDNGLVGVGEAATAGPGESAHRGIELAHDFDLDPVGVPARQVRAVDLLPDNPLDAFLRRQRE